MFKNFIFTYVNNVKDYNNVKSFKNLFIFYSVKNIENNFGCFLDKKIDLFDCFFYLYKNKKDFDNYVYFSSKCRLKNNYNYFDDKKYYFNYSENNIYFLKFDKILFELFELFEHNTDDNNFINFLNDYFYSFGHEINNNNIHKFILPKNKMVYNTHNEKFKYQVNRRI
jgi:hypothetical protein